MFVANTVHVYAVPFVSPVTRTGLAPVREHRGASADRRAGRGEARDGVAAGAVGRVRHGRRRVTERCGADRRRVGNGRGDERRRRGRGRAGAVDVGGRDRAGVRAAVGHSRHEQRAGGRRTGSGGEPTGARGVEVLDRIAPGAPRREREQRLRVAGARGHRRRRAGGFPVAPAELEVATVATNATGIAISAARRTLPARRCEGRTMAHPPGSPSA